MTQRWNSAIAQLLCVSLVVMWGQGTEATASPQPLKDATFQTLPVSDVMFMEDVLWERPARSRLECSVMCRGDAQCLMFTFRPPTDGPAGSCRSHGKQHADQAKTKSALGAHSYKLELVRGILIERACSSDADCPWTMAACFSGQCLCDGGFFFDHTDNACVRDCTRGFADAYLWYKNWDLEGHTVRWESESGPKNCMRRCSRHSPCLSFAWDGHNCFFKRVTRQLYPNDWKHKTGTHFYQKTCV